MRVTESLFFGRYDMIEIALRVESPYKVQDAVNTDNTQYAAAFWRQTRLSSRNIKRHG